MSALAAVVAFAACGDGQSPLDPTEPTTAGSTETADVSPAASDNLAALVTTQRIAWLSYRTGWSDVYKMDPLGNQVTPVLALKQLLQGVAWSWDNKQLATIRYRGIDAFHGHNDIWIFNADGSNGHWARAQTSAWDFYHASFSPDGSRILMTVMVGGWNGTKTLGWLELATGKAGLFWFPGGGAVLGSQPKFNKAGTKILYLGPKSLTVEQINPDGSGHKVLVTGNAGIGNPSYSPDGTKVAFEMGPMPGNTDIYLKNLTTNVTKHLTWSSAPDAFASWSPDGTRLAFMSSRSGKDQVYTMNASTGGDLVRITHTSVEEWGPVWSH